MACAINNAMTTFRPGAIQRRCAVAGCENVADAQHHVSYGKGYPDAWNLAWICRGHHQLLHLLYDEYLRPQGMSLAVVSFRFFLQPEAATLRAQRFPRDAPRQLSFADQIGPQGEAWRNWEREWERYLIERRRAA
jgi:hypothetical protein